MSCIHKRKKTIFYAAAMVHKYKSVVETDSQQHFCGKSPGFQNKPDEKTVCASCKTSQVCSTVRMAAYDVVSEAHG